MARQSGLRCAKSSSVASTSGTESRIGTALTSRSPIHWIYLNRFAYVGVQDARIVAVAYWTPEEPGLETDLAEPDATGEPIVMEAGYYLTRADDPQGKRFASGREPEGEWPDELVSQAGRTFREWGL